VDLKEQEILGEAIADHWHYRAKFAALRRALQGWPPGRLIDVGAGSGFFTRRLIEAGGVTDAICVDPGYAEESDEVHAGTPLASRRSLDGLPPGDTMLAMDVLEHVEDDVGLLAAYLPHLRPGARLVITVPAFRSLWSGHDVFLGHVRRYRLHEAEETARKAGFRVLRGHYFYGAIFPLVAAMRLAQGRVAPDAPPRSQLQRHGRLVNELLHAACMAELPFTRANRLAGLTALVVAERP
jgi:SAM-dependent methyltransferase